MIQPTDEDLVRFLQSRIWSTQTWLDNHGPGTKRPWPEHDIETKRHNIAMYRALIARIAQKKEQAA